MIEEKERQISEKNKAEAEKISGVDTRVQEATIDNLIAQTSNEKVKKGLILGQIRVADAEEELKRNMADWTKDKADETRWNFHSDLSVKMHGISSHASPYIVKFCGVYVCCSIC